MNKFFGKVGYLVTAENPVGSGIWAEEITEVEYYGDIIRNGYRWQSSSNLNDNIRINHQISIVADSFAYENAPHIKYVEYMGVKWSVESYETQAPRILLNLEGVYNGE